MAFDRYPCTPASGDPADLAAGWEAIRNWLCFAIRQGARVIAVECYPGVDEKALCRELAPVAPIRRTAEGARSVNLDPYLTDDPVFGRICDLDLSDLYDSEKMRHNLPDGPVIVVGAGATLVFPEPDVLVYADMPRWEIQQRQRQGENPGLAYKRGYFVDWRIADRQKSRLLSRIDFLLDTKDASQPKLVTGDSYRAALRSLVRRPFRVVPFFDPGPWGGQWMRHVCGLPDDAPNYAWCFNCVPEENSLLLDYGGTRVETPAMNLVMTHPEELLGPAVYKRFGAEFPIRFDFLDTMGGGNLSLQVHPLRDYIRQHFGMPYTQDESYYILDAAPDASVYLGLREGIDRGQMEQDLRAGQIDVERYVNRWPAHKHDHFQIPAGTIHCSGRNALVLEVSATPYIFTFKLWDWGRPRHLHLDHGIRNIQWDRTTEWVRTHLMAPPEPLGGCDASFEERTGLAACQFIETCRHWFTGAVTHLNGNTVNVVNLVEGEEVTVESPTGRFDPLVIHYPETFIVPAMAGDYVIRPSGRSATLKAYVRS